MELDLLWWSAAKSPPWPKPSKYRAPSWSWASVERQIIPIDNKDHSIAKGDIFIEILHAETTPISVELLGQVEDGHILVRGHIIPTKWQSTGNNEFHLILGETPKDERGWFYPDIEKSELPHDCWCLPVYLSSHLDFYEQELHGLVLTKIADHPRGLNVFRRLGYFFAKSWSGLGFYKKMSLNIANKERSLTDSEDNWTDSSDSSSQIIIII